MQPALRKIESRYNTQHAVEPPGGLARPVPSQAARTRVGAVADPMDPQGRRRHTARINVHTDLLELELSKNLISEAAYQTGRMLMALFEIANGARTGGLSLEGGGGFSPSAVGNALVRKIETAQEVEALLADVVHTVGTTGAKLLCDVLRNGLSYRDLAGGMLASERQVSFKAGLFRHHLECLAEAGAARGRG